MDKDSTKPMNETSPTESERNDKEEEENDGKSNITKRAESSKCGGEKSGSSRTRTSSLTSLDLAPTPIRVNSLENLDSNRNEFINSTPSKSGLFPPQLLKTISSEQQAENTRCDREISDTVKTSISTFNPSDSSTMDKDLSKLTSEKTLPETRRHEKDEKSSDSSQGKSPVYDHEKSDILNPSTSSHTPDEPCILRINSKRHRGNSAISRTLTSYTPPFTCNPSTNLCMDSPHNRKVEDIAISSASSLTSSNQIYPFYFPFRAQIDHCRNLNTTRPSESSSASSLALSNQVYLHPLYRGKINHCINLNITRPSASSLTSADQVYQYHLYREQMNRSRNLNITKPSESSSANSPPYFDHLHPSSPLYGYCRNLVISSPSKSSYTSFNPSDLPSLTKSHDLQQDKSPFGVVSSTPSSSMINSAKLNNFNKANPLHESSYYVKYLNTVKQRNKSCLSDSILEIKSTNNLCDELNLTPTKKTRLSLDKRYQTKYSDLYKARKSDSQLNKSNACSSSSISPMPSLLHRKSNLLQLNSSEYSAFQPQDNKIANEDIDVTFMYDSNEDESVFEFVNPGTSRSLAFSLNASANYDDPKENTNDLSNLFKNLHAFETPLIDSATTQLEDESADNVFKKHFTKCLKTKYSKSDGDINRRSLDESQKLDRINRSDKPMCDISVKKKARSYPSLHNDSLEETKGNNQPIIIASSSQKYDTKK